jgi:hypothetical protein
MNTISKYLHFLFIFLILVCMVKCKRDFPCYVQDEIHDSLLFNGLELSLIPNWVGDSAFYYSDQGDTMYLFCRSREYERTSFIIGNRSFECSWETIFPYELYQFKYTSNHPSFQKYTLIFQRFDPQNFSSKPSESKTKIYREEQELIFPNLELFSKKYQDFDTIMLASGKQVVGLLTFNGTFSNKYGLLKYREKSGKRWTLFKYQ